MTWAPASKAGDTDPLISDAKAVLRRYQYGRDNLAADDTSDVWTEGFGAALTTYGAAVNAQIDKFERLLPKITAGPVFDWTVKKQMQLGQYAPPPPIKRRFPAFVFRGTGGVIGLDYVSQVCQANADIIEEINTPWSATMGGLPVGTAGNINDPSMWRGVQDALPLAQAEFLRRLHLWPQMKVVIGGYSAGDIVAAYFQQWVQQNYPAAFLCGFRFGPPTRPDGGGFFGQPAPWGNGIADIELGDPTDYRILWCTNVGDMYGQIPGGQVGKLMQDIYFQVTRFEFNNILGFVQAMITAIPQVMADAGIPLTGVLGALSGGLPGVLAFGVVALVGAIGGLIPDQHPETLTGTAAAAWAAVYALKFLIAGTGPHIRYHIDAAWAGGPTFIDLARMHVRDWCSRPATIDLLH